jgi:hypothetical protein
MMRPEACHIEELREKPKSVRRRQFLPPEKGSRASLYIKYVRRIEPRLAEASLCTKWSGGMNTEIGSLRFHTRNISIGTMTNTKTDTSEAAVQIGASHRFEDNI